MPLFFLSPTFNINYGCHLTIREVDLKVLILFSFLEHSKISAYEIYDTILSVHTLCIFKLWSYPSFIHRDLLNPIDIRINNSDLEFLCFGRFILSPLQHLEAMKFLCHFCHGRESQMRGTFVHSLRGLISVGIL